MLHLICTEVPPPGQALARAAGWMSSSNAAWYLRRTSTRSCFINASSSITDESTRIIFDIVTSPTRERKHLRDPNVGWTACASVLPMCCDVFGVYANSMLNVFDLLEKERKEKRKLISLISCSSGRGRQDRVVQLLVVLPPWQEIVDHVIAIIDLQALFRY